MAERLTIKNSDNTYSQPTDTTFEMVFNKLGKLEDILEKYGIESVGELDKKLADFDTIMKGNKFQSIEELQNALNGKFIEVFDEKNKIWQDMVKNLTKTEQDRDTWKKACELASSHISWCPAKQGECNYSKEKRDCTNYFYQQAKKEGENEDNL